MVFKVTGTDVVMKGKSLDIFLKKERSKKWALSSCRNEEN